MSTSSTAFKTSSSSFVPKKKLVKTEELFPTLDVAAKTEPGKKANVLVQNQKGVDDENKDPTFGKPS
jgi:hypothetical protein